MEREKIIEKIRRFIVDHSNLEDDSLIRDDTNLFDAGILDSLLTVSLLGFCLNDFGCTIEISELSEENFSSLDAISLLVYGKLHSGSSMP